MRKFISYLMCVTTGAVSAADLPVREVVLYKHGVAYFERSGELKAGDTARLDFKAADMDDVLKSLTVTDRAGGKISSIRYDASEPIEKRLEDFPFAVGDQLSMAAFLDRMKGAQVDLKMVAGETLSGSILSARVVANQDKDHAAERELAVLMTDTGELRTVDLANVAAVKFADPKMQTLLKDYLAVLGQAHSKDRRSIYIDSPGNAARELFARYMTPAPVWKSSYRLLFAEKPVDQAEPTLEGWAIVDNTSGEDWSNVQLSVVSGKPISFITELYQPRYVDRPHAELAENRAVGPQVFEGSLLDQEGLAKKADRFAMAMPALAPPSPPANMAASVRAGISTGSPRGSAGGAYSPAQSEFERTQSDIVSTAQGREAGELFEYSFAGPVTVKKGESAMLPFLQQKIKTRKLLIYSENFGLHPMDAAEITNTTGKTLDGGPITVYDAGNYAGEALVETVKAGDKRLISYGVDLGTRVTTKFDSSAAVVREIHLHRGMLDTKSAVEETKTYTVRNVDGKPKTLIIEHPERPGYKLLSQAPIETTSNAYRFEVKLGPAASETFAVREERVFDQQTSVSSMTPDFLATWIQNKALTDAGRRALDQIAAKKREIVENDAALKRAESDISEASQDQQRTRENIESLNRVNGQQTLVEQYAHQLAAIEAKMAALRDTQNRLRTTKTRLQSELDTMMDKLDF